MIPFTGMDRSEIQVELSLRDPSFTRAYALALIQYRYPLDWEERLRTS